MQVLQRQGVQVCLGWGAVAGSEQFSLLLCSEQLLGRVGREHDQHGIYEAQRAGVG